MGKELEIEEEFSIFDKKMEIPQEALEKKDWKAFKRFFQEDKSALLEPFDLAGNTAIHIAAIVGNLQHFKEFLEMLSPKERWHALRRKNLQNSTVLHMTNLSVGIAEIVLNYEKALPLPRDSEIDPREMKDKELPLLEIRNLMEETPFYRAAIDGNLNLLKCLSKQVADLKMHFHRKIDKISILHAAVVAQHFEVALWLLKLDGSLASEKDDNGCTCLQLLSTMPSVFYSGIQFGTAKKFIYTYFLPEYRYSDDDDDSTNVLSPRRDIESGGNNKKKNISVLARINFDIWNLLAREWDGIKRIWEIKKTNKLAEQLADFLVKKDNSWQKSFAHKQRTPNISAAILSTNVSTFVMEGEPNREKPLKEQSTRPNSDYTPMLLAAASGITEIVKRYLELYPQAKNHVSEDELNILHVAAWYRQRKIFKMVKKWKWIMRYRLSSNGNSLLHQVGRKPPFRGRHKAGIAYQLQEELKWFKRVEKIIPTNLIKHCNEDNLTAEILFEREHEHMLEKAKEWIKKTAESCSAVAVLVATVVFAAAYTVPGGNDPVKGLPILLGSPVFLFFTIMDVVALASSLASVVMFLSILTSPFELQDFYRSLPRKLSLGFGFLFFSLTTTMLAFSATILLTIKLEKEKWTSSLIYGAAFFPVAVFGLFQFPFYVAVRDLFREGWKKIRKVLPSSLKSKRKKD